MAKANQGLKRMRRPGISQEVVTNDNYNASVSSDGTLLVITETDWGDTDDITVITNASDVSKKLGDSEGVDLVKKALQGGAEQVYVVRLTADNASKGYAKINTMGIKDVAKLTEGENTPGETVESCSVAFTVKDNKIIAKYSNVPEGYTIKSQLFLPVGLVALTPGRIDESKTTDSITYTFGPAAPRAEYTLKCQISQDGTSKTTKLIGTQKFTMAVEQTPEPVLQTPIQMHLKYPGARKISCQVKTDLSNPTQKAFSVLEDGKVLESFTFRAGEDQDEPKNFLALAKNSSYIDFTFEGESKVGDTVAEVANATFNGGKNPTVDNSSYAEAFKVAERYRYGAFVVNSIDPAIQALAHEFVNQLYKDGRYTFYVTGTQSGEPLSSRIATAAGFNDRNVVCVGPGYIDVDGNVVDEDVFAAQIAGMIVSTPSNTSITHSPVEGAVKMITGYSDSEYGDANEGGLVTISMDEEDRIVVEYGVTSLVNPAAGIEDNGWKKIKRGKVRQEIFRRITVALNRSIGNLPPNDRGYNYAEGQIVLVLNQMAAEEKIGSDYEVDRLTVEDAMNDELYFRIVPQDYDTLDKYYLRYVFSESNSNL